jgi:hypothetical protein
MANWDAFFDDSSENDGTFHGASSTSDSSFDLFQNDLSSQPGGQCTAVAIHLSETSQRPQSAFHTSSTSTKSTGSERISYTHCDGSVWSLPPRIPVPLEPGDIVSSASGLNDPILEHFASRTPAAAPTASPIRQIAHPGSLSSFTEGTGSDETGSRSTELNLEFGWELGTPATSEASRDTEHIFGLDQDHDDYAAGIANRETSLIGLELPSK